MIKSLSANTKKLLGQIESLHVKSERVKVISDLSQGQGDDAARSLIDLFDWSPWRETRLELTRALGQTKSVRAFEHLVRLASQDKDLQLAGEAILALGESGLPEAGAFLMNLLDSIDRPLIKEMIIAIGRIPYMPIESRLSALLKSLPKREYTGLKQYLLLSLGKRQSRLAREILLEILGEAVRYDDSLLLNSALLCAGRLGDETTLSFLRQLDTRYRLFADHLKTDAIQLIESRAHLSLEDVLSQVLSEPDPIKKWQISIAFQSFDPEDVAEISDTFADDLEDLDAAVIALHVPLEDDQLLLAMNGDIPEGLKHAIFQRFANSRSHVAKILADLLSLRKFQLLANIDFPEVCSFLSKIITDKTHEKDLPLLINALVNQVLIRAGQGRDEVGKTFLRLMPKHSGEQKARLIRAIAQIGYCEQTFLDQLRAAIVKDEGLRQSAYYALATLQTLATEKIVVDRLNEVKSQAFSHEIASAISSLGDADTNPIDFPLDIIGAEDEILRLMTKRTVPGYENLLVKSLMAEDFSGKLLALAAGRYNGSKALWAASRRYVNDENPCLKWRAIDTLCLGDCASHFFLLDLMGPELNPSQDFLRKIALSMRPETGADYRKFIQRVSEWLYESKGDYRQPSVREGLQSLVDNLILMNAGVGADKEGKAISNAMIDDGLRREIPRYDELSETVKSVIRNAELMHLHPELFDDAVDKSPAIVQYTKSLDILFQEKIGNALFLRSSRELLTRMQSRIAELNLDDASHSPDYLLRLLSCGKGISVDNFAWHKFTSLLGEIRSGRIMKLQYRAIDGLRAWAILILVFGRDFLAIGQKKPCIFPFQNPASDRVERIAVQMSELQDLRNMAAHRGTVVESSQIKKIRTTAIGLINELLFVMG